MDTSETNTYTVRKALPEDMTGIHALVLELAEYEKAPNEVLTTPEDYRRDFAQGCFDAFVIEKDECIVGMALFYWAYSTWKGKMLYLDDLVVTKALRKNGLGSMLFEAVLNEGRLNGARLMKWQVLDWNEPALSFYRKYSATIETNWHNGKLMLGPL